MHTKTGFLAVVLGLHLLASPAAAPGQDLPGPAAAAPENGERGGPATDRRLQAVRTSSPPDVDGDLRDEAWGAAEVATDFIQFDPEHGAEPSQRTEVRILYTSDAVYVGARMFDTAPEAIIARLSRRDEPVTADRFAVAFDSYGDNRTGFVFMVTAAGVQSDALLFDDTREDGNWDAVWASATAIDSAGWTAELRIPLSQLRFSRLADAARGDTWGVNFQREIARLDERDQWAPFPADMSRMVSAFGSLTDLRDLSQPKNLEIRPYTVLQVDRAPVDAENPFRGSAELGGSLGGSLSYGITPNLTLNATVNPDFGQVEADPSVVNLSAFETFFPEKRPFFTEGTDIFQLSSLGGQERLFYSRRIGRRPHGRAPREAAYSEGPTSTTILGAAKLTGRTSDGWTLGVLNALTAEETTRYLVPGSEGEVGSATTEPLTNYGVARLKKDFRGGESSVGGILTSTIRDVEAGGPMGHLPGGAWTGGLDVRHRFPGGEWEVRSHLLGSHVTGSEEAIVRLQRNPTHNYQRPDADHLTFDPDRTSLTGGEAAVELRNVRGNWQGRLFGQLRTPGFDVNDLGFQSDADEMAVIGSLNYRSLGPTGGFRDWNANITGVQAWTFGGQRTANVVALNTNAQFNNYWQAFAASQFLGTRFETAELRGGPALRQPLQVGGIVGVMTDPRQTVQFGLHVNREEVLDTDGGRVAIQPRIRYQPSNAVQLTLQPGMTWNRDESQYVATARDSDGATHYVMGDLRQRTASLTARLHYIFGPDLSLQLYAQPFISAGEYIGFSEVQDPHAGDVGERFRAYADGEITAGDGRYSVDRDGDGAAEYTFRNPDFNIRQLRSNVVLRWEYMPGSRLFLVWSQDRSGFAPDGRFRLGNDLDGLFGAPSRDVFLVKVEHWLGL